MKLLVFFLLSYEVYEVMSTTDKPLAGKVAVVTGASSGAFLTIDKGEEEGGGGPCERGTTRAWSSWVDRRSIPPPFIVIPQIIERHLRGRILHIHIHAQPYLALALPSLTPLPPSLSPRPPPLQESARRSRAPSPPAAAPLPSAPAVSPSSLPSPPPSPPATSASAT